MASVRHIQQPEGSKVCGAACVAMALGLTLSEAISRFGHQRGVRNREVIVALGVRAASTKAQLWRGPEALPAESLVRVKGPKRRHHLVLVSGGMVYDPAYSHPAPSVAEWLAFVVGQMGWRPVTFFPLQEAPGG